MIFLNYKRICNIILYHFTPLTNMTTNVSQNWLKIISNEQLKASANKDQLRIWNENYLHTKFDFISMNVQYLTMKSCNLLSIKNLSNLTGLIYLDVSDNYINSLAEIGVHKNLIHLNFENNTVIDITQVALLPSLQELNTCKNFIVNQ